MTSPPATTQSSFEWQIARIALIAGVLPSVFLCILLYQATISVYLKIMILLLVVIVISYCAYVIFHRISQQLRTSTNLIEAIINGDGNMRARTDAQSGALYEFNQVVNSLMKALVNQRLLSKERQILLTKVISQIDVAILAVDHQNKIVLMNPSAEKLFCCRYQQVQGGPLNQLGLQDALEKDVRKVTQFELKQVKTKVYLHIDEYFYQGKRHKLIFITDIQKLLREEERRAWQGLLRVLSHEINNSLAPISSISESLLRISDNTLADEDRQDIKQGLAVICERSTSLEQFIGRYRQLSGLPQPDKTLFSMQKLLDSLLPLFPDIEPALLGRPDCSVYADYQQLQQVLLNLIKNANEAMVDIEQPALTIRWLNQQGRLEIVVQDNGMGIANEQNLFIPFYTTKDKGSGIGLVLCRRIIGNHDGDLSLANRTDGQGALARILLPSS